MAEPTPPLKLYRKAKSLTLIEVAREIGISESHLSRIEREGTQSLPVAIKLSRLTGLPVEVFGKAA